jgi:hypothetical protein
MPNSLVALITSYLQGFVRDNADEFTLPCEVQLRGHIIAQELDVVFGAALWTGNALTHVVALNNAFLLTRTPSRVRKFYLYAVLRGKVQASTRAGEFAGLRYTYLLPPDDVAYVDVVDATSQHDLLVLDADVKNYAKNAR